MVHIEIVSLICLVFHAHLESSRDYLMVYDEGGEKMKTWLENDSPEDWEEGPGKGSREEWVECWNNFFRMQAYYATDLSEHWKSYIMQRSSLLRRALVDFLGGDLDALDRFEADSQKSAGKIRQSQELVREALRDPQQDHFLLANPEADSKYGAKAIYGPVEFEALVRPSPHADMSGMIYTMLTWIPDPREARSFMESMVGSPVSVCAGCSRLFVRSKKNQILCNKECQKREREKGPRRKAYRQVFMAFKRRCLEKGLSAEKAREALLQDKKYADLVKKWNFDMSGWKSE